MLLATCFPQTQLKKARSKEQTARSKNQTAKTKQQEANSKKQEAKPKTKNQNQMTAKTIDEVITMLDQIIRASKKEESTLGYFAALYQNVTLTVKGKLNQNYFDDDVRMEQLDVIFANRYLSAYADYKEGKPITKSWEVVFEASKDNSLIVLQHLLLGMNAHINLDLGIAAAEISNENTIQDLEADFNKINEILSTLVNEVQSDLGEIWPTLLKILKRLKKVDDFLINFSMKLARDGAWKFANSLVRNSGGDKIKLIRERDGKIFNISKKITTHGFVVRMMFFIIRIGERGKPSEKIKMLEKLR